MPETTDRADRETPADIPPTLPEGMSRDAIKARETKLRESGRQKTAETLKADDAATREVPLPVSYTHLTLPTSDLV